MPKQSQIDKFREAARALEADEDERKFDTALRRVAKKPENPPLEPANKPKDK